MIASEEQTIGRILEGKKRFPGACVYWYGDKPKPSLIDNFSAGLPNGWNIYSPSKDGRENLYVDHATDPTLLAKLRMPHGTDFFTMQALELPDELKLASELNIVLKKEQAQAIARQYGYADVSLISPVCGVKELKSKKRELLIFPFIRNAQYLLQEVRTPSVRRLEKVGEDVALGLGEYLSGHGFDNNDFGSHQFMVTHDRMGEHLYVVDSEDFRRV